MIESQQQLVCLAVFVLLSGVDVGNVLPLLLLLLLLLQPDRRSMGVPLGTVVQKSQNEMILNARKGW